MSDVLPDFLVRYLEQRDNTRAEAINAFLAALTTAVTAMTTDPAKFKALEPANGWGDYHGALAYLSRLRDACAEHPKAEIYISH